MTLDILPPTLIIWLTWFGIYLILVLSLNLEFGFGGIPNFGTALGMLIGAVCVGGIVNRLLMLIFGIQGNIINASAQLTNVLNPMIAQNPFLGGIVLLGALGISGLVGALIGALIILPAARLKGFYLAIMLLAISLVGYHICYYTPTIVGGYYGVNVPDVLAWTETARPFASAILILGVAFGVYFVLNRMLNSPYGRMLKMVREDDLVAQTYGRNLMSLRTKVMMIGTAIAAIAGTLYSFWIVNVIPAGFGIVEWTFYPWIMMMLGGLGNNFGMVAGTGTIVSIDLLLTQYKYEITSLVALPFGLAWLEYILYGALIILILIYRPQGLIKEKPITTEPIKKHQKFD